MSTTVTYKGETLTTVSNDTAVLETGGTWMEDDLTLTDVTSGGTMQSKSNIDPTTSSQTITPDEGYDGLSSVQINAMPSGTAGTPTATKGAVSNHSISVTPSVTNTTGYITGSTINGTAVTVSASELDSGSKSITANGNSQDVVGYASVDVAVPNSYSASDEGKVVSSGALVAQTSDTVTVNDTYDTTLINSLTVNVSGGTLPKLIDYAVVVPTSNANSSNQITVNLTPLESNDRYIIFVTTASMPSPDTVIYKALSWFKTTVTTAISGGTMGGAILRPDGTRGTDQNEVAYTYTTGVVKLGGSYGTFMAGETYYIYLFEVI